MNVLRDQSPRHEPMDLMGRTPGAPCRSIVGSGRMTSSISDRTCTVSHSMTGGPGWPWSAVWDPTRCRTSATGVAAVGTHGEWESQRGIWTTLVGLRSDVVSMNTRNVVGSQHVDHGDGRRHTTPMRRVQRRDHAAATTTSTPRCSRTAPNAVASFEFGYARKTRSPSLYERYLWVKRSNMSFR